MAAHQEHAHKQACRQLPDEPGGDDPHEQDLEILDPAGNRGAIVFVGQLAGGGGEDHERQDEQAADHRTGKGRLQPAPLRGVIRRQNRECELENVVIARAKELRPEERRKSSLAEELELTGGGSFGHVINLSLSPASLFA